MVDEFSDKGRYLRENGKRKRELLREMTKKRAGNVWEHPRFQALLGDAPLGIMSYVFVFGKDGARA